MNSRRWDCVRYQECLNKMAKAGRLGNFCMRCKGQYKKSMEIVNAGDGEYELLIAIFFPEAWEGSYRKGVEYRKRWDK